MKKILLLSIMIVILFSGCSIKKSEKKIKQDIETNIVESGEIVVKLEETGEINPIKEIHIKSKVSGKVLHFFVEEGDFVEAGDVIAQIEPDYNQAETISRIKNNLELAKIRKDNAEENYLEKVELFEKEFLSANELDDYEDAFEESKINYKSALQQFELIKEIDTSENVTNILSSASGTVIQRLVEEGEMVIASTSSFSEGTVVLKLADLARMVAKSRINEVDISKIEKGQKVNIQVDAYPYESYTGHISKISAMATDYNNIKVFQIEIEIENVDPKLKPGMTANITIMGEKKSDIVVIPIRAIFSNDDGDDIVYKVTQDTIYTPTNIRTGINDFQKVEIIEGLAVGDTITFSEPIIEENKSTSKNIKRRRK